MERYFISLMIRNVNLGAPSLGNPLTLVTLLSHFILFYSINSPALHFQKKEMQTKTIGVYYHYIPVKIAKIKVC
jgi:hypothetical protein